MRKLMGLCLLFVMIACVAGFAADKKLSDRQMDAITAGATGGVVVGGSSLDVAEDYYTRVAGGSGSWALNFITSSGGQVGVGTNILAAPLMIITPEYLLQLNVINQQALSGSVLEDYSTTVAGFDATLLTVDHADLTTLGINVDLSLPGGSLNYLNANIDDLFFFDGSGFFATHGLAFAAGDFVVADGSSATYESTSTAIVNASGLNDVRAINVVTSANAQVGIGLNLAVMNQMFGTETFRQINVINQVKASCGCL
jgi:hypothetical protein